MNIEDFETYLRQGNMAENTVAAYLYAVKEYYTRHKELNKRNLLVYKTYLIETFKPKTVNLRIQALNKYLECKGKSRLRLKSVKVQQRSYLENVISNADYIFLKNRLKREDNQTWYFVVRFLAATGARVSELIQIKVEHVQIGYYDIYTKGGKIRRIYIPKVLRKETAVRRMARQLSGTVKGYQNPESAGRRVHERRADAPAESVRLHLRGVPFLHRKDGIKRCRGNRFDGYRYPACRSLT